MGYIPQGLNRLRKNSCNQLKSAKCIPQGLKPYSFYCTYGTTKVVP